MTSCRNRELNQNVKDNPEKKFIETNKKEKIMGSPQSIIRKASGAGRWFPAGQQQLCNMIDDFLQQAELPPIEGKIIAAIAPHAGYQYSGKVAAYTFRAIKENAAKYGPPDTVIIIGFSHSFGFRGVALMDGDVFSSPCGISYLDKEAGIFLTNQSRRIFFDYKPHIEEHSAENEIPFITRILPQVKIVVAIMGEHSDDTVEALSRSLINLAKHKKIIVIASTDMLHSPDYNEVTTTDKASLKLLSELDLNSIKSSWDPSHQIFCGIGPVLTSVKFAIESGCKKGTILHYRNTGDDYPSSRGNWVVGYGAVVFTVQQ